MKFFKRAFIALAAVLIGLSIFTACNSDSKSNEQSMTDVTKIVTTVDSTTATATSTTAEPTTVKTTQPTTKAIKAEAVGSEKTEDNEDAEDGSHSYISSNVDNGALYSPDEFQNSGVIRYVCDGDGYIVLAADLSMLPRYSIVDTPFGREGKVYDTGCAYGVLDVYVRW